MTVKIYQSYFFIPPPQPAPASFQDPVDDITLKRQLPARGVAISGRTAFAAFSTLPFGFENQPPPPRPIRFAASGAIARKVDPIGVFVPPPVVVPSGYDLIPWQTRRPQRLAGISGRSSFAAFNMPPVQFEVQSPQPPRPNSYRAGAMMPLVNIEAVFVPPAAQTPTLVAFDPTLVRRRVGRAAMAADDVIELPAPWLLTSFESPATYQPLRSKRAAATLTVEVQFSPLTPVLGGLEGQQPPRRPRPERAGSIMRADDILAALSVVASTPAWGYEHAATLARTTRRLATDIGNPVSIYSRWFDFGFVVQPPQPPHPRPERAAAIMPISTINFPFTFVAVTAIWGYDQMPLSPRQPRRDAANATDTLVPYTRWYDIGFAVQPYQPPRRKPERAGTVADPTVLAPLVAPVQASWGYETQFTYRPPTANRARGISGRSQFASFGFAQFGWERLAYQPGPPSRRLGAIVTAPPVDNKFVPPPAPSTSTWGFYEANYVYRATQPIARARGISGRSQFSSGSLPLFQFEKPSEQPPRRQRERAGSIMAAANVLLPLVLVPVQFAWGHDLVAPPPKRGRWYATKGVSAFAIYPYWYGIGFENQPAQLRRKPSAAFTSLFNIDVKFTPPPPFVRAWAYDVHYTFRIARKIRWTEPGDFVPGRLLPRPVVGWGQDALPPRQTRRAVDAKASIDIFSALQRFSDIGFAIQPPQPPHRRIERAGAIMPFPFIETQFTPPPVTWGYEQTYTYRMQPAVRSLGLFDQWQFSPGDLPQFGFEGQSYQPPRVQPSRVGAFVREVNVLTPLVSAVTAVWGHDWTPAHLKRPSRLPTEAITDFTIFAQWYDIGFEGQTNSPSQSIRRERAGSIMREPNVFGPSFAPPVTAVWGHDWTALPPRRRRSFVAQEGTGTLAVFPPWYDIGFEGRYSHPQHIWRERTGALIQPFVEARLPDIVHPWVLLDPVQQWRFRSTARAAGWLLQEAVPFTPPPALSPYGWPALLSDPPRRRWERIAAIARGDDGTQFGLTQPQIMGWEIQSVQPGHPWFSRYEAGRIGPINIDAPFARFFSLGFEVRPPQPPHTRFERGAGAIALGSPGIDATIIQRVLMGWEPNALAIRLGRHILVPGIDPAFAALQPPSFFVDDPRSENTRRILRNTGQPDSPVRPLVPPPVPSSSGWDFSPGGILVRKTPRQSYAIADVPTTFNFVPPTILIGWEWGTTPLIRQQPNRRYAGAMQWDYYAFRPRPTSHSGPNLSFARDLGLWSVTGGDEPVYVAEALDHARYSCKGSESLDGTQRIMGTYEINTELEIVGTFADSLTGQADDPTAVTLYLRDPTGQVQTLTYPADLTKVAVGEYTYDLAPSISGTWTYKWQGTGAVIATSPDTTFTVKNSSLISG